MANKSSNILFASEQRELCISLIQLYGSQFSERDRVIFETALMGNLSINEIANQYSLSGTGVRQICEKTFRKLKGYVAASARSATSIIVVEAERRRLSDENEEFRINSALAKEGKATAVQQGFRTPLTELGFGSRLSNAFARHNIKTIADLKQLSTMDVIGMRQVGRSSIRELEDVLEKYWIILG